MVNNNNSDHGDTSRIIIYGILLFLFLGALVGAILWAIFNKMNWKTYEGFNNIQLGINPETITQKYNIIANTLQNSSQNLSSINDGISKHAYSIKFPTMLDIYVIKQIYITGLMQHNTQFRVAVNNTFDKSMRYVGFRYSNGDASGDLFNTVDTNDPQFIQLTSGTVNGSGFIIDDVTDIYGNNIIGNEIILFTSSSMRNRTNEGYNPRIFITGYPDGEQFDLEYIQKSSHNIMNINNANRPIIAYHENIDFINDNKVPYVITKISLRDDTTISQSAYNNSTPTYTIPDSTPDSASASASASASEAKKGKIVITSGGIKQAPTYKLRDGDRITVLFKNNYSNNTVQYPGPIAGQFIFSASAPTLYFNNTIVANIIIIKVYPQQMDDGTIVEPNVVTESYVDEMRGYSASVEDINKFKLEYNITDIRGSINPDDVCPSMDNFMKNQLSSEIILDTLEYQDRINQEKRKIIGNKENLLRISQQSADVAKLNSMLKCLESGSRQRTNKTDSGNTLHFITQLDQAMKLRDRIESRLKTKEANKFATMLTIKHPYDLTIEDDMRI